MCISKAETASFFGIPIKSASKSLAKANNKKEEEKKVVVDVVDIKTEDITEDLLFDTEVIDFATDDKQTKLPFKPVEKTEVAAADAAEETKDTTTATTATAEPAAKRINFIQMTDRFTQIA